MNQFAETNKQNVLSPSSFHLVSFLSLMMIVMTNLEMFSAKSEPLFNIAINQHVYACVFMKYANHLQTDCKISLHDLPWKALS